eukprot:TRINITY_DN3848_c0_g1_i1.p3 TRINITY_DN3848_c0_g1~~TRINITY_DN3848_c0_g1_i1.p3  ORF type:complete len:272 (-),score=30.04 TRINITY_DN3848_c0_g1_i1:1246-2061(-)
MSSNNEASNSSQNQFQGDEYAEIKLTPFKLKFSGNCVDQLIKSLFVEYEDKLHAVPTLDLSVNPVFLEAHKIFTNIHQKMPNLTTLIMDDCMLTDQIQGIEVIIPQLDLLILANNLIGSKGVAYIVEGLKASNKTIIKLDLAHNKITDKGMKDIMEAVQNGSAKLLQLELSYNLLSKKSLQIIPKSVSSDECVLKELYINGYYNLERTKQFRQLRTAMEKITREKDIVVYVDGTQAQDLKAPQVSFCRAIILCIRKLFPQNTVVFQDPLLL